MQFCFERAVAGAVAYHQRFVEDRNGAVGIARPGLRLGQRNLEQSVELQDVLFAQEIDAATHVLEPGTWRAAAAVAQPSKNVANARNMARSCSRARRASSKAFFAARC